jgi:uncharacterized protein (UPF0276 family)
MTMHSAISRYRVRRALPARAGIGLKAEHCRDILDGRPSVGFVELRGENHMRAGAPPNHHLEAIRHAYPLSLHGVGLSIGGAAPLERDRLACLKELIHLYDPGLFSERLAWSSQGGAFLNGLPPLPYNTATLRRVCHHIDEVQTRLATRMLVENPSTYATLETSTLAEVQFLREVVKRTGCGLLLNLSYVFAAATRHGYDPYAYVDAFPLEHVGEIHLAGIAEQRGDAGGPSTIDAHRTRTSEAVWALYEHCLGWIGPIPTLFEGETDGPALGTLLAGAETADRILARQRRRYEQLLGAA